MGSGFTSQPDCKVSPSLLVLWLILVYFSFYERRVKRTLSP
jgi:hypothetical protein